MILLDKHFSLWCILQRMQAPSDRFRILRRLEMNLGPTELIIILIIVIVLFGVGRIGKIAGELGSGIRSFREGLKGDDDNTEKPESKTKDSA